MLQHAITVIIFDTIICESDWLFWNTKYIILKHFVTIHSFIYSQKFVHATKHKGTYQESSLYKQPKQS